MKFDQMISRVINILTKPQDEWKKIGAEQNTIANLFVPFVLIMAAIPAVFSLLGGLFAAHFHLFGYFLGTAIYRFVILIVFIFAMGYAINEIIPAMGGKKNLIPSMKLSIYTFVPLCLASVLLIIPSFGGIWWFIFLIGLYGVYLLYMGLKALFEIPQDKLVPLVAVIGVIYLILVNMYWYSAGWFITYRFY